jgi:protein-tyrosine phosphatase
MIPAPQQILVVGDDDVCVAPLVAAILRFELRRRAGVEVVSAGTAPEPGASPCSFAAARAIDPAAFSRYRGTPIDAEVVRAADLVLAMTVAQRRQINRLAPGRQRNVFTLQEAVTLAVRSGNGVDGASAEGSIAEFAQALHRRRGLVQPHRLAVPRRGLLRRPIAVLDLDDLLDGHLLDGSTHRWALAQAQAAAVLLGGALRGRTSVERTAA